MAKYLVVPDVSRVAREMTEMSQVKMILSRWLRLGWREKAGVVVNNLKNWRGLVGREFATGVSLLAEMELLAQKADEPRNEVMVLHQQMVDMALALGNKMIIKKFVRLGKDYHIKVGLETNNPEFLVKRLAEWGGEEVAVYLPTMPESVSWKSWQKISPIKFEVMENKKEPKRFGDLLDRYLAWSKNRPVGKIPSKVAKEGAGESRIPFAHLANSLPVYILLAEKLIERDRKRRLRIGDIGCGSGRNISFVKEVTSRSNDEYFGVDYSRACINLAKKKYGDMGVEFRSYGGKRLPFPDSYFDWVVSSHVLEHIRKRGAANYFSEISRVLKNGGTAIIGTPNRKYCQDLLVKNPKDTRKHRLILPHRHEYYYQELKDLLRKGRFFRKFSVVQTINLDSRELMKASVDKFKPAKVGWKKWRYEIYSWVREIPGIQDILARWGTEWLMRRMGIDYRRLVLRTELLPECGRDDDGDNLVVIGKK